MEHLLENDVNKWSTFVKMAPKSGAPIKYTGFQGGIPCIDVRMGLWAQSAYLAKDWVRSGVIVGEVVKKGMLEFSIAQKLSIKFEV